MARQRTQTSPADARAARIGRVLDEFLRRRSRGEAVSEAELLARHPELADDLREHLEMLRDLQPPGDRIDALITQGVLDKASDPRYLAELGSYKITDFIGRGGMGVVLEAYEQSLDRTVALKILRPELADDGGALTRFEREAKAAAALRHPNIVTVHAIGEHCGVHFIAMEYVAGPSLAEVIREEGTKARRHGGTKGREDIASDPRVGRPDAASGLRAGRTEPRPSGSGRESEAPAEPDTGKDTADTAVPPTELNRDRQRATGGTAVSAVKDARKDTAGTAVPPTGVSPTDPNRDRDQSRDREGAVSTGGLSTSVPEAPTARATGGLSTSAAAGAPSLPGVGDGCGLPLGRESSLGPDTIRTIFRQLLSALAAAHDAGLIHRDVKSSNILLDRWSSEGPRVQGAEGPREETTERAENMTSGAPCHVVTLSPCHDAAGVPPACVKLADFGLARMVAAETRVTMPHAVLGTPEYMSPEQARGDAEIDHRTDLYSGGVVLYEMLTGRTPFKADTPTATIHRILHEDPADPRKLDKDVDANLASLALRLMAKRPEDRFPSTAEAMKALDAHRWVRSPEKRRTLLQRVVLGAFVFALLAGGIWLVARFKGGASGAGHGAGPITSVCVDEEARTVIKVNYRNGTSGQVFYDFGADAGKVTGVVLVDRDGTGPQLIVGGVAKPLDNGSCLFAFGPDRRRIWGMDLSSDREWPDCSEPNPFKCGALTTRRLDDKRGVELIVAANDVDDYATRISIIDPRTRGIRATLWHMGQIRQILVAEDFFGPRRPAIVALGVNNKLDGFDEEQPGDPERCASYEWVCVVMILDTGAMKGEQLLNVPRSTHRVTGLAGVLPQAYAYLNLASSTALPDVSSGRDRPRKPDEAAVGHVSSIEYVPATNTLPRHFRLDVHRPPRSGEGAILYVHTNLELFKVAPHPSERLGRTKEYWARFWRPIIQNGEYVAENP